MKKKTKQSHSNDLMTKTNFKKGEIVAITAGVYQGSTGEIFDEIFIANKKAYEIIIGGCLPVFIFEEFLSPMPTQNDPKEGRNKFEEKPKSKSEQTGKTSRRASK